MFSATSQDELVAALLITSRQNPRIKEAVRLRERRQRERSGLCLVDGAREIARALQAGVLCPVAFVCDELVTTPEARDAREALRRAAAEVLCVTPDVYRKIAFGERDDGLVIVAQVRHRQPDELQLPPEPLVAVVEALEKPGNLGAILRSADGAGIDGVIVADGRTDLFNPNTIRASLGTVFGPRVCESSAPAAKAWLAEQNFRIIAARPDAQTVYTDVDLGGKLALVLGSEAEGLSDVWQGADVTAVKLPMLGAADSLNVSTTAAILFYEARRQRR